MINVKLHVLFILLLCLLFAPNHFHQFGKSKLKLTESRTFFYLILFYFTRYFMVVLWAKIYFFQMRSAYGLKKFIKFVKFTGKHLCQSPFFNKVAGVSPAILFKTETLAKLKKNLWKGSFFVVSQTYRMKLYLKNNTLISILKIFCLPSWNTYFQK